MGCCRNEGEGEERHFYSLPLAELYWQKGKEGAVYRVMVMVGFGKTGEERFPLLYTLPFCDWLCLLSHFVTDSIHHFLVPKAVGGGGIK